MKLPHYNIINLQFYSFVPLPHQARSPREHWTLLIDQGEADDHEGRWSLAVGEWDGVRRLAARWNGSKERPAGNPQSRGIASWFVMLPEFEEPLMAIVPPEKLTLAEERQGRGSDAEAAW
jgi:hypothetical protein